MPDKTLIYIGAEADGLYRKEESDGKWEKLAKGMPPSPQVRAIATNEAERGQTVGELVGTESLLKALSETIDGPLDWETRREVVEALVDGISVETTGTGRKKTATLTITYNFSEPVEVVENRTSLNTGDGAWRRPC